MVGEFVSMFKIHKMFKRHRRGGGDVFLKGVMSFVVWKGLNNVCISAVIRNSLRNIRSATFSKLSLFRFISVFLQVTERRTSPDGQVV